MSGRRTSPRLDNTPRLGRARRRRRLIVGAVAVGGAVLANIFASGRSAARDARIPARDIHPFAKVDEAGLRAEDPDLPARARALIQIGEVGIAREDHAALERFFDPDFQFHGPAGAELNRLQLWQYFAACRAAFDDFSVIRQMLMSDGHDYIAARTRFSGVFARTFAAQPDAPIQPNGKRFAYSLINIFRYTADGRLAEEWAQYDTGTFMDQLTS